MPNDEEQMRATVAEIIRIEAELSRAIEAALKAWTGTEEEFWTLYTELYCEMAP